MHAPKTENSSGFSKHPPGTYPIVCTRVIDVGTHWNDRKQTDQRKIMIGFESSKLIEDEGEYKGQPFLLFANFNYSMFQGKAHLCNFIEDWLGKRFPSQFDADNFDLSTLIGRTAFANVVHSDDGQWVNIQTIMPVPEGMQAPTIQGKTIVIDQDNLAQAEMDKLSDKMKSKILSSREQTKSTPQTAHTGVDAMHQAINHEGQSSAPYSSENPGEGMDTNF